MKTSKLILDIINEDEDMQLRVGEIIRLRRHQIRLETRELAGRVGMSQTTIRSIENDKDYSPRWTTAMAILNEMGIKIRFELDDSLSALVEKRNGQ